MSPRVSRRTALCIRALCANGNESPHLVFRSLPDRRCPAALLFRLSFRSARFFFFRAQQPRENREKRSRRVRSPLFVSTMREKEHAMEVYKTKNRGAEISRSISWRYRHFGNVNTSLENIDIRSLRSAIRRNIDDSFLSVFATSCCSSCFVSNKCLEIFLTESCRCLVFVMMVVEHRWHA